MGVEVTEGVEVLKVVAVFIIIPAGVSVGMGTLREKEVVRAMMTEATGRPGSVGVMARAAENV